MGNKNFLVPHLTTKFRGRTFSLARFKFYASFLTSSDKSTVPLQERLFVFTPCMYFLAPDLNTILFHFFTWLPDLSWMWYFFIWSSVYLRDENFIYEILIFIIAISVVLTRKFFSHFIRFSIIQVLTINFVFSLTQQIRQFLPPDLRWSPLMVVLDRFLGGTLLLLFLYCIGHSLKGQYADIPILSENMYIFVDAYGQE